MSTTLIKTRDTYVSRKARGKSPLAKQKTQIEFSLFAPHNEAARLIGSFSDWQEIPMRKNKKGYFNVRVLLADGTHQYKFKVQSKSYFFQPDEWITISDPYATAIDKETQNAIIRLKDGKRIVDEYIWKHDGKPLPPNDQLVIYELHVGDFSGGEADPFIRGKFTDVVAKLDYLVELGINAIEMMPVKENPGTHGWGYNPRHFFAVESSYGTSEELKHMIDECHAHGIRVLMDDIYNHSEQECPLAHMDYDYWYRREPKDPIWNWGPEFNYEFYDEKLNLKPAWKFMGDAVRFWVSEYHIDGLRFDAAKQLDNYDLMRWISQEAKQVAGDKPFYCFAEMLPLDPSITGAEGPMDGCWHDFFRSTSIPYLRGDECNLEALKDIIDARRKGFMDATNVINYLTNHDQQRAMFMLGEKELFGKEAFKRVKLGVSALITSFGLPMIFMGEEFGEVKEKRSEVNKIDWQLLAQEDNKDLFNHCKNLIAFRKSHPALWSNNLAFFHEDIENNVLAYLRWTQEGDKVVVILNLSDQPLTNYVLANFPEDGVWLEYFKQIDFKVNDQRLAIDLPERDALILVRE
jgi:1,4-alpha-glucan branching enzyme